MYEIELPYIIVDDSEFSEDGAYLKEEDSLQKTIIKIKKKYGKNKIIKGHDLEEGGTTIERNNQIGGHKA